MVVQVSGGSATCTERTKATIGSIVQACTITQGPSPAGNVAKVDQSANQKDDGSCSQDVTQTATVMQTAAGAASNSSSIKQSIGQACKKDNEAAAIGQNQEAHQIADVTQNSESGNNDSGVKQSQDQDEKAMGAALINQFQNTDERLTADCVQAENLCYRVSQQSTSGKNRSDLNQTLNQSQDAKKTAGGRQAQGACMPSGTQYCTADPASTGLLHAFLQQSSGVSTQRSDQDEKQAQRRKDTGAMAATQVGPTRKDQGEQCCNADNRATQSQTSKQDSTGDVAVVSSDILSDTCSSFGGLCTVHQEVDANGFKASNDLTAPAFTAEIACASAGTTTTTSFAPTATGSCTPTTTTVDTSG